MQLVWTPTSIIVYTYCSTYFHLSLEKIWEECYWSNYPFNWRQTASDYREFKEDWKEWREDVQEYVLKIHLFFRKP